MDSSRMEKQNDKNDIYWETYKRKKPKNGEYTRLEK